MKRNILFMILVTAILFQVSATAFADNESKVGKKEYTRFEDFAPDGTEINEFECLAMAPIAEYETDFLSTDAGIALIYATTYFDYSIFVEQFDRDFSTDGYVGFFENWVMVMFCPAKDEYVYVMFNGDDGTAAYYKTGVYTGEEAAEIMKESLPNHDCTEVDTSLASDVFAALVNTMSGLK